ncbi:hypothetical protein V1507DRAFT_506908 [Lipomyces tetrasporus]
MVDRSQKSCTLEVNPAPYAPPGENEIVVKSGAVAINPVDWLKQDMGDMMFSWIKYPFVLASDVAGEVVQIGRPVSRFKVGDRVIGHALITVYSNKTLWRLHIRAKFISASTLIDNGVGKAIYVDILPKAVAERRYIAAPGPHVVGKGLDYIQSSFDLQKKGMSAKKAVVFLMPMVVTEFREMVWRSSRKEDVYELAQNIDKTIRDVAMHRFSQKQYYRLSSTTLPSMSASSSSPTPGTSSSADNSGMLSTTKKRKRRRLSNENTGEILLKRQLGDSLNEVIEILKDLRSQGQQLLDAIFAEVGGYQELNLFLGWPSSP